jgi:hypothetical protein
METGLWCEAGMEEGLMSGQTFTAQATGLMGGVARVTGRHMTALDLKRILAEVRRRIGN